MDLTAEQQRIVEHGGGPARVVGAAGTGRTTALVARYLRLLERHRASQVLVLCRDRAAALRFGDAVLPGLAGGFDSLPVTTVFGLAFDLVTRADGPVELLTTRRQRQVVRRLLAADDPAAWPGLGSLLRRPAFADAVAEAVLEWQRRPAAAAPADGPWAELGRFADRYRAHLAAAGLVDSAGLLARAAALLRSAPPPPYAAVLVDDVDPGDPSVPTLVAGLGPHTVVAGPPELLPGAPELGLSRPFRHPAPPELVTCGHPSMEPEAIARELLASHHGGVDWSDMAVLVRRPGPRARSIATGLARHGVPVVAAPAGGGDDPVVRSVVDVLRWAGGDDTALGRLLVSPLAGLEPSEVRRVRSETRAAAAPLESHPRLAGLVALRDDLAARIPGDRPAELAFEVWRRGLGHLVTDGSDPAEERVLDGLVAFLDGLSRDAERHPEHRLPDLLDALDDAAVERDPWRVTGAAPGDGVTVTSIGAATGREWHTVVVSGCVEGELPRVRRPPSPFDPAVLAAGAAPPTPERRRAALADERRLFDTACSRATGLLLGAAAPAPGVLLSRFVEGWARRPGKLPEAPGPVSAPRSTTVNPVPVFPDGHLHLSATALDTYDDCPLRYAYQYALRVREDAGVRADLGTLVHGVLAEFLDPDNPGRPPRTRDALLALARERWVDDIARYRPQVEEARRLYFEMLEQWWEAEGEGPGAPEVLAVERRFDIEVGAHRLTGSIDRVDRADDGHGIRIVDYKTGKSEPAAGTMADNLQLAVYHLAATRDPGLMAMGPPTQLRLLFLRTMHQYEQPVIANHAGATEARVLAAAERIRAEQFDPSVDANCRICPFHRLCPMQEEGRQVAAGGMAG